MQITTKPIELSKYPYIGELTTDEHTTVVFFVNSKEGFCLYSTDSLNLLNRYSYGWEEDKFIPCEITIR
jgi:hypothetical protein